MTSFDTCMNLRPTRSSEPSKARYDGDDLNPDTCLLRNGNQKNLPQRIDVRQGIHRSLKGSMIVEVRVCSCQRHNKKMDDTSNIRMNSPFEFTFEYAEIVVPKQGTCCPPCQDYPRKRRVGRSGGSLLVIMERTTHRLIKAAKPYTWEIRTWRSSRSPALSNVAQNCKRDKDLAVNKIASPLSYQRAVTQVT